MTQENERGRALPPPIDGAEARVPAPTHEDMVAVQAMRVSPAVASAFADILRLSSAGRGFRVVPVDEILTTQQAADRLNVSRPHVVKLLDGGTIPYLKTGRHRRIRAADLADFERRRVRTRSEALDELVAADQEAGLL